jgi:hypothetical protein
MDYVKFIYQPLAARAARQVLVGRNRVRQSPDRGRFTRADVDALLKTAWGDYSERAGKLPPEPTVGSRMNVRLACFTMAFFNALLASGTDREYAIELVADAAWKVYRLWSIIALGLAHLTPGKTTALAFAVSTHGNRQGVSLRFPFNAPGYLIEPVPTVSGRGQATLFPECLADWIDENNPVQVIDVFVDELDLAALGFEGVAPEVTGRPATRNRKPVAAVAAEKSWQKGHQRLSYR